MTHVVVVEDDPLTQRVIHKALTKLGGYQVTITESVEETLQLARSGAVGLVVMDIALANTRHDGRPIDGVTFTQLLKSDPATRALPVLLATAYAGPGDAQRLLEASGADGYISKPLAEPRHLVERVREMLAAR
jgi:CheY-like chemotaxis protein